MTSTVRLRHLAQINPPTPDFEHVADDDPVVFMPLETVWADARLDMSRVRPKGEVATGYVRFAQGDILCPKVTPTFQAGRSALMTDMPTTVGAASTEVHVVRARPGLADARFLRYGLLTKPFLEEGVSRFQGVAGLQRVPDDFLRDLPLRAADIEEQRRTADFLDDQVARIDNIIAAHRQQQALLEEGLTSRLAELFFSGPTVPMRRLVREAVVGIVVQPAKYYVDASCGVPALRGTNVDEGEISTVDLVEISHEGNRLHPRSHLIAGDVVVVRTGDAGTACVVPDWAIGWNCIDLVIVRTNRATEPQYIEHALNAARRNTAIAAAASGSIQQHFGVGALLDLPVGWRGPDEQKRVVASADEARAYANAGSQVLAESVAALVELKRSLITAAVTGEFDVTTADGSRVPA
jgi:type I restriction enzyme S subunit